MLVFRRGVTGERSWTSRDRPDAARGEWVFDQPGAVGIGVVRHGATQHTVVERSAAVLAAFRACELSKKKKINHLNQAGCSSRSASWLAPSWPGQRFSAWLTQPGTARAGRPASRSSATSLGWSFSSQECAAHRRAAPAASRLSPRCQAATRSGRQWWRRNKTRRSEAPRTLMGRLARSGLP